MNNKKLKLILSVCFILASVGFFNPAEAATSSFYRHVEYAKVVNSRYCPLQVGIPCPPPPVANFVCSPFVTKLVSGGVEFLIPTDKQTTPEYINWQGVHSSQQEAINATIASLENCLSASGFVNLPFPSPLSPGWGLYGFYDSYYPYGYSPSFLKTWVYKDTNQIVVTTKTGGLAGIGGIEWTLYVMTGTARQVTYLKSGLGAIEDVKLHTTICSGESARSKSAAIGRCPVMNVLVPTSKLFTYGIDLKVNSLDSAAVDPGSDINLSWSSMSDLKSCTGTGWNGADIISSSIIAQTVLSNVDTGKSCETICSEKKAGICTSVGNDAAATNYTGNIYYNGSLAEGQPYTGRSCSSVMGRIPNYSPNLVIALGTNCRCTNITPSSGTAVITLGPSSDPKTYTLTCEYSGGSVSDTTVVTINDLGPPGAPQSLNTINSIVGSNLPGNTVSWTAPASASPITGYEIVKYGSCVSKTADAVKAEVDAGSVSPLPLGSSLDFKDSFVTSGSRYTYAVRAENERGGPGPFAVSGCSSETLARQQLFTLTGSGFKPTMTVSLENSEAQASLNCINPPAISENGTKLAIVCEITDFTPVGQWNIVVHDGGQSYSSPADVFLSIIPKNNSLPPSDISSSAQNPSVVNGIITLDSISGKNISESATVELVRTSDNKRILCVTPLSQITAYNSDGSVTLNGVSCNTNSLGFGIGGASDWKVVVKNSLATNGLSSDPSLGSTLINCTPNCSGKVCGSDQCGGFCKDTDGLDGTAAKPCTKANVFGTCSGTGIKYCNSGVYSDCSVTNKTDTDPRIAACGTKECGDNGCGGQCGYGYAGCPGKGFQYTCSGTSCVCTSPVWAPDLANKCGLVTQTSTNCSPAITQLVNGGLAVPSGYKCVNNGLVIDTAQCTGTWARYNKCIPNNWTCGLATDLCGHAWSCNSDEEGECNAALQGCANHTCADYSKESGATD